MEALMANEPAEPSRFDVNRLMPVIHPLDGRSIGAITDPLELMASFRSAGLEPDIRFSYPSDPADSLDENLRVSGRFYLLGMKGRAPDGE